MFPLMKIVLAMVAVIENYRAETKDNTIPPKTAIIFWGRSSGGNFVSFLTATNETNYFRAYSDKHCAVNYATYGLIVKNVTTADADTYTLQILTLISQLLVSSVWHLIVILV